MREPEDGAAGPWAGRRFDPVRVPAGKGARVLTECAQPGHEVCDRSGGSQRRGSVSRLGRVVADGRRRPVASG
ncbi:hypothetical protein C3492_11115 [Streptomyces sp. Ru62]|nr:hypothetical protein C3492_11115 [Streptomyces sp. Ru62]